tara:strand:- start:25 stop:207 length:183 start_codon:yes stop_codon:yes gene_type:complete
MKIYSLTIVYDEDSDEIEYIEESLDDANSDNIVIATIDKEDYERTSTIETIMKMKKIAEA